MAIQFVCDRCDKNMGDRTKEIAHDNELHFTEKRNTRFGYDKRLNLCDDCIKKFWDWMKDGLNQPQPRKGLMGIL